MSLMSKLVLVALVILALSSAAARGGGVRHRSRGGVLSKSISELSPDVVVDKRGGGNLTTIADALRLYKVKPKGAHFVIYISEGTYEEHLVITVPNVVLIGDGMTRTVITGNRSRNNGYNTEESATLTATITGVGFMARDLSIHNTAGAPGDKQAVALFSAAPETVLFRCDIRGFQDTLLAKENTHFYRDCHIWGTVDFIFGDAAAVFQDCFIFARPPASKGQPAVVTAQGRLKHDGGSGFVFQNCTVKASTLPGESLAGVQTYLGRPWKHHARTVFLLNSVDSVMIHADGWKSWNETSQAGGEGPEAGHSNHIIYAEYKNRRLGGSSVDEPLRWNGFYSIKNDSEAEQFTPGKFIRGRAWLPRTGVSYYLGLTN
ncbi:unnamed protein product [Alopecurus aequalis]